MAKKRSKTQRLRALICGVVELFLPRSFLAKLYVHNTSY